MRADFRCLLLAVAFLWGPVGGAAAAPPTGKTAKICSLSPNLQNPGDAVITQGFKAALAERGYVEGRHFTWHARWGDARPEVAAARAKEFAEMDCTIIVAGTEPAVVAAQRATSTIPIVMLLVSDPVRHGFVKSLARPGGNITGMTNGLEHLLVKRVEIGLSLLPGNRVGVLASDSNPFHAPQVTQIERYGRARATAVVAYKATQPEEVDRAFAEAKKSGIRMMVVLGAAPFAGMRPRVASAALAHGIGTAMPLRSFVEVGGLFNYSLSLPQTQRDVSLYIDKILNGERPADLPVLEPSAFDLVINRKTAEMLGVAIPQRYLISAEFVE